MGSRISCRTAILARSASSLRSCMLNKWRAHVMNAVKVKRYDCKTHFICSKLQEAKTTRLESAKFISLGQ